MGLKVDTKEVTTVIKNDTKSITTRGIDNSVSVFNFDNIKEHKEELAIASGIATAGLIGLSLLTRKRLPKHIDFRPAKTVEEAIKYSKKLKIKKLEGMELVQEYKNLEAINKANEELVRLNNLNKGDVKMPKILKFVRRFDNRRLAGQYDSQGKEITVQVANVNGNAGLNKYIDDFIKLLDSNSMEFKLGSNIYRTRTGLNINIEKCFPDEILELYKTYKKQPWLLNRGELDKLNTYLRFIKEQLVLLNEHNYTLHLLSGLKYKDISSMSTIEINKLIDSYNKNPKSLKQFYNFFIERKLNELYTLDHEFAHAQFCKKPFLGRFMSKIEKWKGYNNLLSHELKDAPDFVKEFFSKEGQFIAGKVSAYARTSVHEFLAEVYAMLVQGNKLDKEVIDLYIKCGGKIPKGLKDYII